jgi:O-antigen/teichoic acid export membrane protein
MLKNIASTFGSKLLVSLLNLAIVIVISRYLEAEGRGVTGIFVSMLAFIALFNSFIGGSMIVYLVPRYPALSLFAPAYLWAVVISAIFFFLLPFTDFISIEFRKDIFLISLLQSFTGVNLMILLGRERIMAHNLITAFQVVVNIAVLLVLFIFADRISIGSYVWSLYAAAVTGFAFSLLSVLPLLKHDPGQGKNPMNDIIRFGFLNQLAALAQFLSYRISFYFLEQHQGEKAVGIYANGCSLAEAIWLVGNSISLIQYARLVNSSDKDYAAQVSKKLTRANVAITLAGLIVLVIIPSSFYTWLFGKDFTGVQEVIWTLAPGVLAFGFTMICSHYFAGIGMYRVNAIASSLGLIAAVAGCWLLVPGMGITGAGIASSLSYIVTTFFVVIVFMKRTKTSFTELIPKPGDITELFRQVRQLKPTGK